MFNSRTFWKIYLSFILFTVLIGLIVGIFVTYELRQNELRRNERQLTAYANLFDDLSPGQLKEFSPSLEQRVRDLHQKLGVRITIIRSDGVVAADSDEDFSKMNNHANRPEVIEAREKGSGVATRFSNTLQKNMMFAALPIISNGKIIGYSRASFPLSDINQQIAQVRNTGVLAVGIGALLALLFGLFLARQIVSPLKRMTGLADSIAEGDFEKRIPTGSKDEFGKLAKSLNTMAGQITQGISRRETVEAELRKSEQYQNLFRLANDAILVIKPEDETVLDVNNKACEMYGFSREEFIGMSMKSISLNPEKSDEQIKKLLAAGEYQEFESVQYRADGAPMNLLINASVIEYQSGQAFLSINRDITSRKEAEEDLRESEQHLLSVTNSAQDAIVSADNHGNIIFWNEGARNIFGYDEEEVVGKPLLILMPEKYREAHAKGMWRYVETGEKNVIGQTVELHGLKKDGTEFPLELSLGVWETAKGKYFTFIMRDITERQLARKSLRESEQRYRYLGEGIMHQVWTALPNGELDYVNNRTCEYFGRTSEQIIGEGWQNVIHPEDLPNCIEKWTKSLEKGADYEVAFRLKRADGEYFWHLGRATAGRDADENIIKWFGTNSDIHSQKSAEKASKKSEEKFRSIIETTNDWIWEIDLDGNSTYNNPAIETILGYMPEELHGKSFLPFMFEEDRLEIEQVFPQFIAEKRGWNNLVCRWNHKDGSIRYLESSAVPVLDDGGEVIGFRGTDHDITERMQAEEKLRASEEWLRAILDGSRDGIIIEDGKEIVYINNSYTQLLGYDTPEELVGKNISDILPAENAERLSEYGRRRLRGEKIPSTYEFKGKRKDGTLIEVEGAVSTSVIGDRKYIMTAIRDIAERKQARAELQKNVSLLTSTFEATADGILVVDLDDNIVTYNEKFIKMWQIPDEIIKSRDNKKAANYVLTQLENSENFTTVTEYLTSNPEIKNKDILKFKDGKIFERYNHPQMLNGEVIGRVVSFRDITERKRAESALRESEERFRSFMNNSPAVAFMKDEAGRYIYINKTMEQVFDLKMKDLLGKTDYDWLPEDAARNVLENDRKVLATDKTAELLETVPLPDGSERKWLTFKFPVTDSLDNKFIGGTAIDVTDKERDKIALSESEYKLRTLVENMSEGLLQVDKEEVITYVNNRFCEMIGYEREELLGKTTFDILLDEEGGKFVREANRKRQKNESNQYELRLKTKSGETLWTLVGGVPIYNISDEFTGTMGVITDITQRKRTEDQLLHDAFHDALTGLANRTLFMDHLRMTIERGKSRHSNFYAVLFLDFDRFKIINDSLGHAEGDKLLKLIAKRLQASVRTGDLVARIGGDEFVILLSELVESNEALLIAERIQNDLKAAFDVSGREIIISASIGVALSTAGHESAEDMLRDADIAMYRAKGEGRADYRVFDQKMHEHASNQLQLETEMRAALKNKEFEVHYQPIINLETESLVGFESLIRWNHPERGMIPPFEFISVAEENGMILPLGQWILYESCRQLREWQNKFPSASGLTISVNLSCKEFLQFDLAEQIAVTLKKTGLDPHSLKLEITESHVMENSEVAVTMMKSLRKLGVRLSLDDFGTGYSSLSYLHRLPVDFLKIDRSFVMRMADSEENHEIVRTIIKLAQNLKMKVIAEGIETADQLAQLKHLNCEYGQGYFFSKPLEAEKAKLFIEKSAENSWVVTDQPIINVETNM